MSAVEVNFDGLIGPSHNYGGLSDGNLASGKNGGQVSRPREAALQGLEKMRFLLKSGLVQGVLPPPKRPNAGLMMSTGSYSSLGDAIEANASNAPRVLKAAYSASTMWAANAATVSPSADTADGRLHLSSANLVTMLHRSVEHPETGELLSRIFGDATKFAVGDALPSHEAFGDEGAANHVRLCASHGAEGVELFVYGRDESDAGTKLPARQSLLASQSIAHRHGVSPERTVFARQAKAAIDAGAFHNDVVCVGALETLFFHELAFEDTEKTLADLRKAAGDFFDLKSVMVPSAEVPIGDAITSYLFNSQLLAWPGEDRLVLLAPTETRDNAAAGAYCERLVQGNGPIGRVEYVDVRQSMRNGGGPACLRLRVVMTDDEIAAAHQGVFLDEAKIDALQAVVSKHYREELSPDALGDPSFAAECAAARAALLDVLDLSDLA